MFSVQVSGVMALIITLKTQISIRDCIQSVSLKANE
jgi:hypothetical protein